VGLRGQAAVAADGGPGTSICRARHLKPGERRAAGRVQAWSLSGHTVMAKGVPTGRFEPKYNAVGPWVGVVLSVAHPRGALESLRHVPSLRTQMPTVIASSGTSIACGAF
jgi:hypothetical protein